jgi:hypothetical protein
VLLSDIVILVIALFPDGCRSYGLQDEGNGRVWGTLVFNELTA